MPPTFGLLAYGQEGAGKSTWLLTLAQELARHGEVLYVAAEEGQANSMIEKLSRLEILSDRIHISSAISPAEMQEDLAKIREARFLFIDSLSYFPMTIVELSEIAEKRRLGVAFSLHCCKDGSYRGATSLGHWVDVKVKIEQGTVVVQKNRFGPLHTTPLEFAARSGRSV
ncbi:MAG: hypothetical protein HS116_19320 [Planctomycetes bacterium]|nr:hypothetical protein [Planctomycetota bacterium]